MPHKDLVTGLAKSSDFFDFNCTRMKYVTSQLGICLASLWSERLHFLDQVGRMAGRTATRDGTHPQSHGRIDDADRSYLKLLESFR